MKALVVYESMFGNTASVAQAVADGLSEQMDVDVREVSQAPAPVTEFLALIVLGAPTHAFSLSRPATRAEALQKGATNGSEQLGIREWIGRLGTRPHSEWVATFDTRSDRVRHLPGSAAHKAARLTKKLGYTQAGTESFYVTDVDGPLDAGELDRARRWGAALAEDMLARSEGRPVTHRRARLGP